MLLLRKELMSNKNENITSAPYSIIDESGNQSALLTQHYHGVVVKQGPIITQPSNYYTLIGDSLFLYRDDVPVVNLYLSADIGSTQGLLNWIKKNPRINPLPIEVEKTQLLCGFSFMDLNQFGHPVRTIEEARQKYSIDSFSDQLIQLQLDIREYIRNRYPEETELLESYEGYRFRQSLREACTSINHPIFNELPEAHHPENVQWGPPQ